MNREYIIFISWFAFLCYAVPLLLYISKIYHYLDINNLPQVLNYSLLSCAFLAFSLYTSLNAYYKTKQSTSIFNLNALYTSPARLGYGIMVLSFFITLGISWFNGEPLYFQRLFAIVGYGCLALKIDIGLFFVIGFYIFNLILAPKITINDYIYATSKVGLIVYFSTYAYQFILDKINKNKKDKQKQE